LHTNPRQPMFMFLTTVYTHGPYPADHDQGEGDYSRRLTHTLQETAEFVARVIQHLPDTLILLVGDHKPGLTRYLYEQGVLTVRQFEQTGDKNEDFVFDLDNLKREEIGDVPGYIYYPNQQRVEEFTRRAHSAPMFCMMQLADEIFVSSGLPAFEYARQQDTCNRYLQNGYDMTVASYPSWLYDQSLFAASGVDLPPESTGSARR